MACGSCGTTKDGVPGGCNNNGSCGNGGCNKLNVFDWLANMELPHGQKKFDYLEVRFKNSRKDFFKNDTGVELFQGDVVAVEATSGHDMGIVSLAGELVRLQMKKKGVAIDETIKKIYRKAKQTDIDKWKAAQALEVETMFKARTLALNLGLQMKISDVEYQGDKTKAIFYYTADERVDFRELIKVMAQQFSIRIEMRQIGARQEASRLGGIGSCGRELCCSTWLTDFRTVNTSAARYQQLSLNPLKLAGQCGKLKCCLNYELDAYVDALKEFPDNTIKLQTKLGSAFHQKSDIFKRKMWYSYVEQPSVFHELDVVQVKKILELNAKNEKPTDLKEFAVVPAKIEVAVPDYENVVGQDSLTRFDKKKSNNNKPNNNKPNNNRSNNNNNRRKRPQNNKNNTNPPKPNAS